MRWARRGGGKSGGGRVIYYYYAESMMMYPKNRKDSLKMAEKNDLKRFVGELLKAYGVK